MPFVGRIAGSGPVTAGQHKQGDGHVWLISRNPDTREHWAARPVTGLSRPQLAR